jgi:hypothetical protein
MALSGSIDLTFDARATITYALRKLGVLAVNQSPTAAQAAGAMTELNLMLKGWQRHESLWRLQEGSATLIANDADYTLSPVPHRVVSARYRDANSLDTPMALLTRAEYFDQPQKTATGVPTNYYVDYQRTSAVMYVWPLLSSVTTETIKYTYFAKQDDIDSLDDEINIRQEFFEAAGYNLADRLAADYGRSGTPRHQDISLRALTLLEQALDEDREDEIRFVPDYG